MDVNAIRTAYAAWAGRYDRWFGPLLHHARMAAIAAVNSAPGKEVLEVGVGTGLALPLYNAAKRITCIDLSSEMLLKARNRTRSLHLENVVSLLEMDAQETAFKNDAFDIAVAMFVASVVPSPQALLGELRRIVKPGGTILFVNHFAQEHGIRCWFEHAFAPASARLGWHSDFHLAQLFGHSDLAAATVSPLKPFGLFQLVKLEN